MAGRHSKKKQRVSREKETSQKRISTGLRHELTRRSPRPTVMWNWLDLVLIGATLAIAFFASSNIMGSTLAQLLPGIGQATLRLALVLVFYVIEILVVIYIAHRHNFRFATLYRLRPVLGDEQVRWYRRMASVFLSTLLVLFLLILTRAVGMSWNYLTESIGWLPTSTSDLLTMFGTSTPSMWLAVLCVVVFAPFIEEIIFRGVFLSTFETIVPSWISVVMTAAIFALYHASVWAFVLHFFHALALGYLATTRKTLWPAILLHALYNATLIAAALYTAYLV